MMEKFRNRLNLRKRPEEVQTPSPAPARAGETPLSKDPITVEQADALQCADALQEIYLVAAPSLPPTSPLHQKAERARRFILAYANLSPNTYPELVRPWVRISPPAPTPSEESGEKKKEKRPFFMG